MTVSESLFGISSDARDVLAARASARRAILAPAAPAAFARFEAAPLGHTAVREDIAMLRRAGGALNLSDPYHRVIDGVAGARVRIGLRDYDDFTSYNYLGLNGDPRVNAAAKAEVDRCGTSASASRIVSGERPVHGELERALADVYDADDCLALVSGHATNVAVIGHLVDRDDVILHDALCHNSVVQGAIASRAQRVSVPHNDLAALERALAEARPKARRALVIVEGHYSMDGDVPDVPRLIEVVRRWGASLMIDEAHALGVLGATGRGVAERCGADPRGVDVWMGTLSKTLSGCGGYIAGSAALIDYLRNSLPAFIYSVGLPPPIAAAALQSLRLFRAEPERVAALQRNGETFLAACRAHGLDTGRSVGAAIVPVVVGSAIQAVLAARALFEQGINVHPIIPPAVPDRAARLRFFISSRHTSERLHNAARETAAALSRTRLSTSTLTRLLASLPPPRPTDDADPTGTDPA